MLNKLKGIFILLLVVGCGVGVVYAVVGGGASQSASFKTSGALTVQGCIDQLYKISSETGQKAGSPSDVRAACEKYAASAVTVPPTASTPASVIMPTSPGLTGIGASSAVFMAGHAGDMAYGSPTVSQGRVSGYSRYFEPAINSNDAEVAALKDLPPDAKEVFLRFPESKCEQLEFTSVSLSNATGVAAVLVNLDSESGEPFDYILAVHSAVFTGQQTVGAQTSGC